MSFRNRRFPCSLSTPNINETSSKVDIPAWLHRDGPPWSVWKGQEVGMEGRTAVPWGQNRSGDSLRWAPTLQRATSVPDVLGGETKAGFSSITITSRKVSNTHIYQSHETLHPHAQPHQVSTARLLTKSPALSSESTKSSKSALEIQRASILKVTEDRQGSSIFDRVLMRGAGRKRAGLPEYRYSYTEGHKSQDAGQSSRSLPPLHSFRSCLHLEVPPVSSSSVLFLNKSLSISLGQAEDGSSRVHRSTLSLSVGRTPHHRSPKTNPQTDCRISRVKQECTWKLDNQRADSGHSGGHALQRWGCEILRVTCSDGANRQSTDSDTQRSTPRLLSFREPGLSYTGASWQNGNADEKCYPPFSNFRHKHPTCNVNPGDFRTKGRQPLSEEREERKERLGGSGKTPHVNNHPNAHTKSARCSCPMADISALASRTLSLREALEQFRPDFISRSQGRVRRLEQRARRRRALQDPNPDLVQGLWGDRARHRGDNYTKPDPLSDNLFRPRERSISDHEMHLRSRRIYNKLPEVTKKKEEEKRRVVSQTNRLRAELFKKRLLDQLLQR
ncbi:(E2-independent) E3 ubiquitin-conjugating enzyme FATS-like [Hypomesus transpacificus]|uniref:(E2-independent) E3 ubiquitin-conjugating enzyme FATS-like n=1 Tax=Hypomesus transpacificus TaxID=137520 RepID=UPI001F07FAE8|nr:(E2-independent) E3 ubiquitin-conjugating enzyme FATS-like [Hypomesus transpacificus]